MWEVPDELSSLSKDPQDGGTLCLRRNGWYIPDLYVARIMGKYPSIILYRRRKITLVLTCHLVDSSTRSAPTLFSSWTPHRGACLAPLRPSRVRPVIGPPRSWDPSSPFLSITTVDTAHHLSRTRASHEPIALAHFKFRTLKTGASSDSNANFTEHDIKTSSALLASFYIVGIWNNNKSFLYWRENKSAAGVGLRVCCFYLYFNQLIFMFTTHL